jgi:branched-chain amino acid transport system ATP-binding protein
VADIILEARGLTKSFGGFLAVENVDLAVRRGAIHALIGPNGAGKTTLFNLLTCLIEPTAGAIFLNGKEITGQRPDRVARAGMVRSFQISAIFPHFNVRDNVVVALQQRLGISYEFWRPVSALDKLRGRADELLDLVGLAHFAGDQAVDLSYGRKRVLELATTLAMDPSVLLLDEPMAGLGREDIRRVSDLIRTVGRDRTVLMVEHNLSVVADLSDTITVLTRGHVLAEGSYSAVSRDQRVIEAYLGAGHA